MFELDSTFMSGLRCFHYIDRLLRVHRRKDFPDSEFPRPCPDSLCLEQRALVTRGEEMVEVEGCVRGLRL